MGSPVDALLASYPRRFTRASAQHWVASRRALLASRAARTGAAAGSVSSGCATTAAWDHTRAMADDAAHALRRLDAGLVAACEGCSATLPLDRLDSAPAAVRCTGCMRAPAVDTRWCR